MNERKTGRVLAVCRSDKKGTVKKNICSGFFIKNYGLQDDAHSGKWHRQVSLLGIESINKMERKDFKIDFGDFAENITTENIILYKLIPGTRLLVGKQVLLEVTQIGKKCHHDCEIKRKIGQCVMPREGIFARVIHGGKIEKGDIIKIL